MLHTKYTKCEDGAESGIKVGRILDKYTALYKIDPKLKINHCHETTIYHRCRKRGQVKGMVIIVMASSGVQTIKDRNIYKATENKCHLYIYLTRVAPSHKNVIIVTFNCFYPSRASRQLFCHCKIAGYISAVCR